MKSPRDSSILISGLGVNAAIGQGREAFAYALLKGQNGFGLMQRPGRSMVVDEHETAAVPCFIGAEIKNLHIDQCLPERQLRSASLSTQVAVKTLHEAWEDACLSEVEPERIGLVVGGSNFQQRELVNTYQKFQNKPHFLRPSYAMSYMDTDLCGLCSEIFGIKGLAYSLGGASASGQLAVIQATQAVMSGQVDVCIALGALMDLSYWECQGFRSIGAMGSDRFSSQPELAARPFDRDRDGFIFGESCGAVVIEKYAAGGKGLRAGVNPYARIIGWGMGMDANRNPDPSLEGECAVIAGALDFAQLTADKIDYINPHGTGSTVGDEVELKALERSGLKHAWINTTKSILGHSLSAAGTVEIIATLLQMRKKTLHPSRNLVNPIDQGFQWVREVPVAHEIRHAITLSMGFGGINTALCLASMKN